MPRNSIIGKEIFAVGKWNGDAYTQEDLEEMVKAYKETEAIYKPYIKLGHDEGQEMLQEDGYPAAGWIENIRVVGNKLVCDFVDLPDKVYKLIINKAYRYVSSEILWNIDILGKKYHRMISGCSLLGTEMPACLGLNDFANLYKLDAKFIKKYTIEKNGDNLMPQTQVVPPKETEKPETEVEIKVEPKQEVAEPKKEEMAVSPEMGALSEKVAALEAQVAALMEKLNAAQSEAVKYKMDAEKSEIESFMIANQIAPAAKEYVKELLGADKKEYSINDKKLSKPELIKEILKVYAIAGSVNLEENSQAQSSVAQKDQDDVRIDEIKKYAQEKKMSFADAYREIGSVNKNAEDDSSEDEE